MSNGATRRKSVLATVERVTATNKTVPRNKTVRRNSPHCVAGNLSVETTLGLASFHDGKSASTGYAIGSDGRMGLGVEETNRPWTTSSATNDHQAVTFEIANDGGAPDWHMSDAAINKWLDASVEIATFYGYNKVSYQEKPSNITGSVAVENWIASWANSDEMIITLHNWYANKACPGPYFMRQLPWLVKQINHRLAGGTPEAFIGEGSTASSATSTSERPTLKQGSTGIYVAELQTKLNKHGANPGLTVDSSFGVLTDTAVRAFQTAKGLTVDGVVGPATWAELDKDPAAVSVSQTEPTVSSDTFQAYTVKITASALNVRKGSSIKTDVVKCLVNDKNTYTIVEEADGPVNSAGTIGRWGKLKSGIGWISLDYVTKVT